VNSRLQYTLLLVALTIVSAITATMGFQHVDIVRGFFDARAGHVTQMYIGILGVAAALACVRPQVLPIAFGFIAGSQLCFGVLNFVIYLHPMNPVTVLVLVLIVGAMGSVHIWKRAQHA